MELGLRGKRAFISGSSQGIGYAVASALAAEGVDVVINGRDEGRVDAAMRVLALAHPEVTVSGIAAWYMKNTRGGREFYAIGSDPAAAELYGLRVTRRVLTAFVLSGALAGLAGVFYAARYGTINSQAGAGWELDAVGAAVIGGVAITGGIGSVWGAAIGAVLLLTINRALPILGIPDFWQRAVVGLLIIGAIVLDRVLAVRQRRRLIEARDES